MTKQTKVSAVRLVNGLVGSGRGPSPFDPSQGWWDEADQSVGSPFGNGQSGRGQSNFDPSQGWWDEADESVGSPFGNGQSGRGPSNFDPSQGWWDEADESVGSPLCYKPYYSCNHQGVPYN